MDSPKILLVDDEENILNALSRLIKPENYQVTTTSSPYEALHLASQEEFSVVVSDYTMSMMKGVELLEKIKEISPQTIRILLTAHADMQMALEAINRGDVYRFLTKPWDDSLFAKTLKDAVQEFKTLMAQRNASVKNDELRERYDRMAENNIKQAHENQKLSEALEKSHVDAIEIIAHSVQLQNANLWHHLTGVTMLCRSMARLIQLPREQFLQLEAAALLHDIGKSGIPEAIFNKPISCLTDVETELLNNHPVYGFSIVSRIPLFQEAAYLIRCHHEAYDGSGFPDGLAGGDIPSGARIIAVADAYAKYARRKPQHDFHFSKEAFDYLDSQNGKLFDPMAINLLRLSLWQKPSSQGGAKMPEDSMQYWQTAIKKDVELFSRQPSSLAVQTDFGEDGFFTTSTRLTEPAESLELNSKDEMPLWISMQSASQKSSLEGNMATSINSQPDAWTALQGDVPVDASETGGQENASPTQAFSGSFSEGTSKGMVQAYGDYGLLPLRPGHKPAPSSIQPILSLSGGHEKKRKQAQEIIIDCSFLCAGMMLSQDLITQGGKKLLDKDSVIQPDQIAKIKKFLEVDPPRDGVHIYRSP